MMEYINQAGIPGSSGWESVEKLSDGVIEPGSLVIETDDQRVGLTSAGGGFTYIVKDTTKLKQDGSLYTVACLRKASDVGVLLTEANATVGAPVYVGDDGKATTESNTGANILLGFVKSVKDFVLKNGTATKAVIIDFK